jgi:hypothetical protein
MIEYEAERAALRMCLAMIEYHRERQQSDHDSGVLADLRRSQRERFIRRWRLAALDHRRNCHNIRRTGHAAPF